MLNLNMAMKIIILKIFENKNENSHRSSALGNRVEGVKEVYYFNYSKRLKRFEEVAKSAKQFITMFSE